MDFIDFYTIKSHSYQSDQQSSTNSNLSNLFRSPFVHNLTEQIETTRFSCLINKNDRKNVVANIQLKKNNILHIKSTLISNFLIKCISQHKKLTLIKFLLKRSSTIINSSLKINLLTGQVYVSFFLNIASYEKISISKFQDFLLILLKIIIKQTDKYWKQILFLIQQSSQFQQQDIQSGKINIELGKNIKTYGKSSSFYAWNIIQGVTNLSTSKQEIYYQKKSKFRKFRSGIIPNNWIRSLSKCYYGGIHVKLPFFILKIDDDEQLRDKYLTGNKLICKNNKIINEIELKQNQIQKLKKQNHISIQLQNLDAINLETLYFQSRQQIRREKSILSKIKPYQYQGLPRYYFINNIQQYQNKKNLILMNTFDSLPLIKYLKKNKKILTINTKLHLLNQISNTLIYLRDSKVLYNNLSPKNIKLKKGLQIKLFNMKNAFHQDIQQLYQKNTLQFPYKSIFQNLKNSNRNDQRSDSYSLGVLMYEILFDKKWQNIKSSTSQFFDPVDEFEHLCRIHPYAIQALNYYGKYEIKSLYSFISQATSFKIMNPQNQEQQMETILNGRPYLDWFAIITKYLSNKLI